MAAIAGTAAKRATGGRLPAPGDQLEDLRFRSLLGREGWDLLPSAVQNRFAKRLLPGKSVTYAGIVAHCRMTVAGWLLAQLCRHRAVGDRGHSAFARGRRHRHRRRRARRAGLDPHV